MLSLEAQNKWREAYRQTHPGWRPATEVFAELVRHNLRPQSRLLDVGCGRGGLVEQLGHPLWQTTGIDPDFTSLWEHRLEDFPRAVAVSDCLPFVDSAFEVVTASWLLEHLADPIRTFRAISRVLAPAGSFVFITPNKRHPLTVANRMAGRLGRLQGRLVDRLYGRAMEDTFATFYRANTAADLNAICAASGLRLAAVSFVADPSYIAFNRFFFQGMSAIDARLETERQIHIVGVARKG